MLVSLMASHQGISKSYSSKRVCLDMLATSPPMIFHGWYFKASVRNGSPPRHQGILNSCSSKRACLDKLATSPPRIFKIDLSKLVSELARHLASNEFLIQMVQREPVWICSPPCHQGFINNHFPKLVLGLSHYLATIELLKTYCSKRACLGFLTTSDFTA